MVEKPNEKLWRVILERIIPKLKLPHLRYSSHAFIFKQGNNPERNGLAFSEAHPFSEWGPLGCMPIKEKWRLEGVGVT